METQFDIFGYFLNITYEGKFMGTIRVEEQPGRVVGYLGRQYETLVGDIITCRKKVVKAGSVVQTEYFPLCGRIKNK